MYLPPGNETVMRSLVETTAMQVDNLKQTIRNMKVAMEVVTRSHKDCRCTLCIAVAEADKVL